VCTYESSVETIAGIYQVVHLVLHCTFFLQKIDKVLKRFGSNIIFSNGMRDPWSRGGVLKNISSSIIALVTEKGEQEGAHHLDLRSATKGDPDWVIEQRRQEVEIIQGWIDQYHQDMAEI